LPPELLWAFDLAQKRQLIIETHVIRRVLMQQISETKPHPHPIGGLAEASIRASHARKTCTVHSKSEHSEMGSAPGFLAAIQWISMLPIRENKPHPRPMRGFAWASIQAPHALRTCTVHIKRALRNEERPGVSRCHSMDLDATYP
jgi:hypothetical protein